ncbi:MAG: S-layer homology domain-containing protein [Clostridia bacterium]|nr:S-layer homology domain-containing protein [Clostridia bacterium]
MKKRILLLTAMMLAVVLTVTSVPLSAEDPAAQAEFVLSSASAKPGDTVKLILKATSKVGVISAGVALQYDESKIEFIRFSDYGDIIDKSFVGQGGFDTEKHTVVMAFISGQYSATGIILDDNICSVELRIRANAPSGDLPIKVIGVAKDLSGDLQVSNKDGVITVEGGTAPADTGDPGITVDTDKQDDGPDETQDEWKNPFKDVSSSDPYYEAVKYVYINGIFNGVAADRFAPMSTMTRAMFVTVLGRIEGVDQNNYPQSTFKDVEQGTWYTPYVSWANEYGIVKGYDAERFGPNNQITIEQAVVIIGRFARYTGNLSGETLSDTTEKLNMAVSDWAIDDMCWAIDAGIYKYDGASPQSNASRSLIAEMLYAFQEWRTK